MKVLVTGRHGQVGYELMRSLQSLGQVIGVGRSEMDLCDPDQVRATIRRIQPTLIVNAAAYTAVDEAESRPELAMQINGLAPGVMAEEAAKLGAAIVHYSTDYVFDGTKQEPYTEGDAPSPLNVYGRTKLAGEQAISASGAFHLIFRTSWVYGTRGKNFLLTMNRLAAERKNLAVVDDQFGAPTWSRTIADTTACILSQSISTPQREDWWKLHSGIYHLTAQGSTTWRGFADAIFADLTDGPTVTPISSSDYQCAAARPKNSILSSQRLLQKFCYLPDWRDALALCKDQ